MPTSNTGGDAPKKAPAKRTTKKAAPKPAAPAVPQMDAEQITAMMTEAVTAIMTGTSNSIFQRLAAREEPTDVRAMMEALAAPFDPAEIDWRPQGKPIKGRNGGPDKALAVAYVKARAVQDRLDEVCPGAWQTEYKAGPNGGIMCGISIRIVMKNGLAEWVTRWDGAENTNIEAVKGGFSDAEKRAAVQWGVFRYGYRLPTQFVPLDDRGRFQRRPELPPEFLPQEGKGLQRDDPERQAVEQRFRILGTEIAGSAGDWDLQRPFVIRAFSDHFGLDVSSFSTHALTTDQLRGLVNVLDAKKKRGQPLIGTARQIPEKSQQPDEDHATEDPDEDDDVPPVGYDMGDTLGDIDPDDDLPF